MVLEKYINIALLTCFIGINIAIAMVLAPLLDGVERKIRARLQNRKGPPITQTIYDLSKLYKKKGSATSRLHALLPYIAFVHVAIALAFLPSILRTSISIYGDLVLFIYLVSASVVYIAIGSIASGNPFAGIGASREISMLMIIEFIFALIASTLAITHRTLVLSNILPMNIYMDKPPFLKPSLIMLVVILAILIYIESLRFPFELAEAEPELASGILIEYGGPHLATVLYTLLLRRYLLLTFLIDLVLPRDTVASLLSIEIPLIPIGIDAIVFIVLLFILTILFSSIEAFFGRYRIDIALRFMKKILLISFVVIILALIGF